MQKRKPLTPQQVAEIWRKNDYAAARADDQKMVARDPWQLDLNDNERARLQRQNPYLWRQLIDRGFIDQHGNASQQWRTDPRNGRTT